MRLLNSTVDKLKNLLGENLFQRVMTAIIVLPVLVILIEIGGIVFTFFVMLVSILAIVELMQIFEAKGFKGYIIPSMIASLCLILIAHFGRMDLANFIITASILAGFFLYTYRAEILGSIKDIAFTFFSILYIGWLLSHVVLLRNHNPHGKFFLYFAIAITMLNDTGAYFVGKSYGRKKLAPRVSPSKTWEGVFGGLITSLVSGLIVGMIKNYPGGVSFIIVLSILVSVFAVIGDLAESLLKRDAQIKDSGSIFPGHGGVLDRIDSLLFTIPCTYYMVYFFIS